jgi:regulator of protease activity HflC (stomatin/prohibitin superfamily)
MTSERKVLADDCKRRGNRSRKNIRSDAERSAADILANAEGEATPSVQRWKGEAAKSLAVFQQNPELANFIFRLNALEASTQRTFHTLIFRRTHSRISTAQ